MMDSAEDILKLIPTDILFNALKKSGLLVQQCDGMVMVNGVVKLEAIAEAIGKATLPQPHEPQFCEESCVECKWSLFSGHFPCRKCCHVATNSQGQPSYFAPKNRGGK